MPFLTPVVSPHCPVSELCFCSSPEPPAGFPNSLQSLDQMCHFLTMCIFTCTGQHSSTHLGQVRTMVGSWEFAPGVVQGAVCRWAEGLLCLAGTDSRHLPLPP